MAALTVTAPARWQQLAWLAAIAASVGLAAASLAASLRLALATQPGWDFLIMRALGARWLATGTVLAPYQLAGPYDVAQTADLSVTPGLYPPAAGPVFGIVAALPLPVAALLWWGVPLAVIALAVRRWRPARWSWPLLALLIAWPQTSWKLWVGGTDLLLAAAVAAGLLWRWPAALVLLKPTLAPFALVGIRSRWWWAVAAVVAALTLLGPWRDYIVAIGNARTGGPAIAYSLPSLPLLLLPVVAWAARTTSGRARRGSARAAPRPR